MNIDEIKITRSFRLTPQTVELVVTAAEKSGWAQGDIIEECVKNSIMQVTQMLAEKRAQHLKELGQLQETLNSLQDSPSAELSFRSSSSDGRDNKKKQKASER